MDSVQTQFLSKLESLFRISRKVNLAKDSSTQHEIRNVKLHITNIKKHVAKFDFEEEYEEI